VETFQQMNRRSGTRVIFLNQCTLEWSIPATREVGVDRIASPGLSWAARETGHSCVKRPGHLLNCSGSPVDILNLWHRETRWYWNRRGWEPPAAAFGNLLPGIQVRFRVGLVLSPSQMA